MKALHAPKPTLRKDRRKGGGDIYRCDGRVELTPGRSVRVTATGGTKQEAKTAWIEKAERARSGVITSQIAACAYFTLWLDKKRGQVANATVKRYEVVINNHLNRHFNGVLLADIRRSDIETLVANAQGRVRSATVKHMVATISSILSSAVNDGVIARSPASRIPVAPDAQERIPDMVDPRQMLELLERQQPSPCRDLLKLLTVIPLRLNEVRGLRLGDFTHDFAEVHISQSATRDIVPERKTLKTRSGRRSIVLPDPARAVVLEAVQRHADGRFPSTWLFDMGDGNPPTEGQLRGYFKRLKLQADWLPKGLRIHDLRAGMATYLASSGESIATVQLALGHSDPVVTMRHYTFSTKREVTAAFDKVWGARLGDAHAVQLPPKSPPNATNGVDEGTVPNMGKAAFHEGRSGGERGIRTLDGVAPKPHFQCGVKIDPLVTSLVQLFEARLCCKASRESQGAWH